MTVFQGNYDPAVEMAGAVYKSSSVQYAANCVTSAPGLAVDSAAHLTVKNANTFFIRQGVPGARYVSYLVSTVFPALNGSNLAFDDGTVPPSTNSCRIYTFIAKIANWGTDSPSIELSVIHGNDFPKHRNATTSDFNLGDGTGAIVGYLYVKNESSAVFIPGTTLLNASGITASPSDQFGFLPVNN